MVFAKLSITINIALTERQCFEETLSTELPAAFVWLQFSDYSHQTNDFTLKEGFQTYCREQNIREEEETA